MIISTHFADDSVSLARQQQDVYSDALWTIIGEVRKHVEPAARVLGLSFASVWHNEGSIDHRTMQDAHDVLAARWRWTVSQPDLLDDRSLPEMVEWFIWLREEVATWWREPELSNLVLTILNHQNQDRGYAAEDELSRRLVNRFHDMEWLRR